MARPLGSRNVTRVDVTGILKSMNCNPFVGMVRIGQKGEETGDYQLAGSMYRELAKYIHPQLKAIEHSGSIDGNLTIQVITGVPSQD